jgi:hypothetical protein
MMSHANITVRDELDRFDRLWLDMEKLKVELKFVERQRDEAEKNLKSIFDRIETGEPVYLQYNDGRTVYIEAAKERETK